MTVSSRLHVPWEDVSSLPTTALTINPFPYAITGLLLVAIIISVHASSSKRNRNAFPLLNPKGPFEISDFRVKKEYDANSREMMKEGMEKFKGKPFRVLNLDYGEALILPPSYANEIRNNEGLSFGELEARRMHHHLPGFGLFEALRGKMVPTIAQYNLTPSLPKLTTPLSKQCDAALNELVTDNHEWHEINIKGMTTPLVARLSTLAFMGPDLCENQEWITITTDYSAKILQAGFKLQQFPWFLRRLANNIVPLCRASRAMEARASEIIDEKLAERQRMKEAGEDVGLHNALEWFNLQREKLGGKHNATGTQLCLSLVAIHTTSDLLSETILSLARHPDLFEPLRREIVEALEKGQGFSKSTLYGMKLLDSVIKETQRMNPVQVGQMERGVLHDMTLSGNIQLKKGDTTLIMPSGRDPQKWEKPNEFDAYRFYRLRQEPGKENTSQLVTTSGDYLAFGHGAHACPGRFFAAHEIKIAMCHLLLKYDWKFPEDIKEDELRRFCWGNAPMINPLARIEIRRRDGDEAAVRLL